MKRRDKTVSYYNSTLTHCSNINYNSIQNSTYSTSIFGNTILGGILETCTETLDYLY